MEIAQNALSTYSENFVTWLIDFIPSLFQGLAIAIFSWYAGLWTKHFIDRSARRLNGDEILWSYLGTLLRHLVVAGGKDLPSPSPPADLSPAASVRRLLADGEITLEEACPVLPR